MGKRGTHGDASQRQVIASARTVTSYGDTVQYGRVQYGTLQYSIFVAGRTTAGQVGLGCICCIIVKPSIVPDD